MLLTQFLSLIRNVLIPNGSILAISFCDPVGVDETTSSILSNHTVTTSSNFDSAGLLANAVKQLFKTEAFGTEFKSEGLSPKNQHAKEMLEKGIKKFEVGYEATVLWRKDEHDLIDNIPLAQNLVERLVRQFKRDPK